MRALLLALVLGMLLPPAAARGQSVPTADGMFGFPGANASPGSAASAGLALADRWLGDEPFDNPAMSPSRGVALSPMLLRVSRQDLRAANRSYDEQPAFFDAAGGWVGFPLGGTMIALYAHQPVVRLEDNAFVRGRVATPTPTASVGGTATVREIRAGVAVSRRSGPLAVGAAAEWTRHQDDYEVTEESGAPTSGTRGVDFSGDGVGGSVGARLDLPRSALGAWSFGAAARFEPELELEGTESADLLTGAASTDFAGRREAAWSGGLSVQNRVTEAFRVVAGFGGRAGRAWEGFGAETGAAWTASLGVEFHDARDPWTVRLGGGREGEAGSLSPRAGIFGIGVGWDFDGVQVDVGAVRRSLETGEAPTSFDDRVVVSVRVPF